jgi:uncharacterized protein with WD repeat
MKVLLLSFITLIFYIGNATQQASPFEVTQEIDTDMRWIELAPNGEFFLASDGYHLQIWNVEEARSIYEFTGHVEQPGNIAWSPDSHYLAIGTIQDKNAFNSPETHVTLWDANTQQTQILMTIPSDEGGVYGLNWHPSEYSLVLNIEKNFAIEIGVWDIQEGTYQVVSRDQASFVGNLSTHHSQFAPDGSFIMSVGRERLYFWDAKTYEPLRWFEDVEVSGEEVIYWSWSPDGNYLLLSFGGIVAFARREFIPFNENTFGENGYPTFDLTWKPDSSGIITGNGVFYSLETRSTFQVIPINPRTIQKLLWTSDGKYLIYLNSESNQIEIWNTGKGEGKIVQIIHHAQEEPSAITLTTQNLLAIIFADGRVCFFKYQLSE